ncbi:MAG TPA: FG-GAP-like repeat-containing protein [Acidisarcina sp.]
MVIVTGAFDGALALARTPTTTTLRATSGGVAVTTVASGSVVTLTASVSAGSTPVSPGQVIFCDAAAKYCTDIHVLGTAQLTSPGTAVLKFHPGIGSHTYKAVFQGTNSMASSASAAAPLSVTGVAAPIASTSTIAKTGNFGSYALTGTVTEIGSTEPPTGTVSFLDTSNSNRSVGTAALGAATPGVGWLSPSSSPTVGAKPLSIAVGDFNRDGTPDFAVANVIGNSLSILLGNGDGTFAATTISVPSPQAVVAADFNGDGIIDLAVSNSTGTGGVTILLGNGDGTFAQTSASPNVGFQPLSMTVADFNGDGIPDIAVSSPFTTAINVLIGKGDGTFVVSQLPGTAFYGPSNLVSADFNGDGNMDLITVDSSNNTTLVLLGNGDGTFSTGTPHQLTNEPGAMVVADLNGDGKLDLAIGSDDGVSSLTILLGNGDGTFTEAGFGPPFSQHPQAIGVGDFNGDGIVDVALPNDYNNTVAIFQGNGDGTFTLLPTAPATGDQPETVAVFDVNGDGRPDIVTANYFGSSVTVLLTEQTETATATDSSISLTGAGQHLVTASYPGDTNYNFSVSSPIQLWGQPPATTTTLAVTSGGAPVNSVASGAVVSLTATVLAGTQPVGAGQVGFCDGSATSCTGIHLVGSAALTTSGTATFKFIPGPGQHSYRAFVMENAYGAASASAVSTLTVSAPPPVVAPTTTTIAQSGEIGNYTLTATVTGTGSTLPVTGSVSFLNVSHSNSLLATAALGASTAGLGWPVSTSIPFTGGQYFDPSPLFATGDFNGDGILDMAVVNTNSNSVTMLMGKGDGAFNETAGPTTTTPATSIVVGDFNGDGKLDLAVLSRTSDYYQTSTLTILLGNGDGTFTPASTAPAVGASASVFAAADFNGDGKLDLLVNDSTTTEILLGNGDGTFAKALLTGFPNTIAVGDLNGDGLPDIVVGPGSNAISVYLSSGDGSFHSAGAPIGLSATAAVVSDFNGDGIPDLAVATMSGGVDILPGVGDGTFTPVANGLPPVGDYSTLAVADFNHDGKADLAVASNYGAGLSLFLGNGDGTFTQVLSNTPAAASHIITGDFNGDGTQDLAVGIPNGLSVLLTEPTEIATATASGVAPATPIPNSVDASYPGDSNYKPSTSDTTDLYSQVATPVFTPVSGTYTSTQTLTITDATPGATIYYQAAGTINVPAFPPTQYTGPITLDTQGSLSIQAYATVTGYQQSATASANYVLNLLAAPTPVITPGAGSYPGPQSVTITDSAPGVSIYYTTDGTVPTPQSTKYTGAIPVSTSETLAAIAIGSGYKVSLSSSALFYIDSAASSFVYSVAGNGSHGYAGDGGAATAATLNGPELTAIDGAGDLYIADGINCVVRKVDARTGIITTVAGSGTPGYNGDNGPATSAEIGVPAGLALDSSGNLYISDNYNGVVRKVAAGTGTITTVAGNPSATALGDNGPATAAMLQFPAGLVLDSSGNLYIATSLRIRMVNVATGAITTFAGVGYFGSSGDNGPATAATLEQPVSLAIDHAGNIYLADQNASVIRKIAAGTGIITTVAGVGSVNTYPPPPLGDGGPATSAVLNAPMGVAVDVSGNIYIADTRNNQVRKVTASDGNINRLIGAGPFYCTTLSGDGGPAISSGICEPTGVTVDPAGDLYIAEYALNRVREVTAAVLPPTVKTSDPVFTPAAGTFPTPQIVSIATTTPRASTYLTLDGSPPNTMDAGYQGSINVTGSVTLNAIAAAPGFLPSNAVTSAYTITQPPTAVINTIAGDGVFGPVTPGAAATSQGLSQLNGVAVDSSGNVYFSDPENEVVWMVSAATGNATIFAGVLGSYGDTGDGGLATAAELAYPGHVAIDAAGNVYIVELAGHKVRKVAAGTGIISTYAGGGQYGILGDNGPATSAYLSTPAGVALDPAGNLYISDESAFRVRKVSPDGTITTVAGGTNTSGTGEGGPATSAFIYYPQDVATDSQGNLYIADSYGRVRLVTATTGIITTIAGNGAYGESGDGNQATRAEVDPAALTVDPAGNVYLANSPNTIRRIDAATHIITTIAGSGYTGFSGDGGQPTIAELCYPNGLAIDKSGSIYISDSCNYRIRKVTFPGAAATPVLSLAAGTYQAAQSLTITDATSGATIYYTTDGSTPTAASTVYSGAIAIASSETVNAIAIATGFTESAVATAAYTINIPVNNPTPVLTALSPAFTAAGSATFTLTATGSGFIQSSTLYWGSTALATQFVGATSLTAQVPAALIGSAGISAITVQSPAPGGGTSNSMQFEIDSAGSTPATFTSSTATISPGSTASYPVTLPSSATNVSVTCLNLPSGATCGYAGGMLTITTTSAVHTGTYQVTGVFTETLPGAAAWILLPIVLLPLAAAKKRARTTGVWLTIAVAVVITFAGTGCGGGGSSGGGGSNPPPATHQATSSGVVTLIVH